MLPYIPDPQRDPQQRCCPSIAGLCAASGLWKRPGILYDRTGLKKPELRLRFFRDIAVLRAPVFRTDPFAADATIGQGGWKTPDLPRRVQSAILKCVDIACKISDPSHATVSRLRAETLIGRFV